MLKKTIPVGRSFSTLFLVLLATGIALSYSESFGIGFYFDDTLGIVQNPSIRSLANIPKLFTDPMAYWTDHTQMDLRPVLMTTYAVNYALTGLDPWSYHLFNLFLLLIASAVVFLVVRDHLWEPASDRGPSGNARVPAAAAALLFALAPLNSQPVLYPWARSALLCTTLYVAAFLAFLLKRRALGSLLQVLALLTKAIAITLPALLVAHNVLYRDRSEYPTVSSYVRDWRRSVLSVSLPGLLSLAYLGYRWALLPAGAGAGRHEFWVTPWIWFMSQWSALLYYVRLFIWPDQLSMDHDFPYATSILQTRAWLPLLVLMAWLAAALLAARRHRHVAFATLWFFITLATESSFVPLAEVVNDHRPFLASALGLSVLVTWLLWSAAARLARQSQMRAFVAACFVLCSAAVLVNRHRTWQWGDALRIWEDTVRKSPNNARAWMNAGLVHMSRGDVHSARREFERALTIAPTYAYLHMNLSVLEAHEGNPDKALAEAEEAVRLRPDLALTHYYLGQALEGLGRFDEAALAYQRALNRNPRDLEAQEALSRLGSGDLESEASLMSAGLAALKSGDADGAAARFREVLARNPSHYGATYQLAGALDASGNPYDARPLWLRVREMAEGYGDQITLNTARARLARTDDLSDEFLMKSGLDALYRRRDALAAADRFRKVLERNPSHYGATYQLAYALEVAGRPSEARTLWERALRMAERYRDEATAATARAHLSSNR